MNASPFFSTILLSGTLPLVAAEYHVGTGHPYATPSAVARVVQDGDTVRIHAGTYRGDVCVWRANRLTLIGDGADQVILDSEGKVCQGKGIWVIQGKETAVSGITFTGAKCPDKNGAGIRLEGNGLTVRNCTFRGNENGILCGSLPDCEVTIEGCTFARNGAGDGYSHNLYIGKIKRLTFRKNSSHHANLGHALKSRALENIIQNNRFDDGTDGRSSYLLDLPNGGKAVVTDNYFRQSPLATNAKIFSYGEEKPLHPSQDLTMERNTLIDLRK
ncbi:MAG: right-handed parallel beta-helix repeat-containing protein [Kiritimatiellae bacterium]|nr:right-handed parallel beta-helix repeat-containing protein [Kiritimatiellia bacterium]